jgi:uncharacterized protein HemY
MSGDPGAAIQAYTQALKIQPSDVGYLLLGRALQQSGQNSQAQSAEAEAQRLSRDFPAAEKRVDAIFAQQTIVGNPDRSPDGNR